MDLKVFSRGFFSVTEPDDLRFGIGVVADVNPVAVVPVLLFDVVDEFVGSHNRVVLKGVVLFSWYKGSNYF
jgi:hypothetical protein